MVYAASLSLLTKKALGAKCHQSSIGGIVGALAIDPAVSGMDVVLLGARDLDGAQGQSLMAAVANKHPGVCVIYLCTNEREAKKFPAAPNVKQVRKITDAVITDVVNEVFGKSIREVKQTLTSSTSTVASLGTNPTPPKVMPAAEIPAPEPGATPAPELDPPPIPAPVIPEAPPPTNPAPTAEDVIDSVKSVGDWDILKKQLDRDNVIRQLILENNEFAGISNMLEVWDLRIRDVWADPYKSDEEKMQALREFGTHRQVLQATFNSVLVDKFVSLMERTISICTTTVEKRVAEIRTAVASLQSNKDAYLEYALSGKDELTEKLFDRMVELQAMEGELCKMFAFMDNEGMNEIVKRLDEKLPSTNEFINNVLTVSAELYRPANTVNLGETVMDALSKGQVQLSMVEDKVKGLMNVLFGVIAAQADVIQYQRNVISCLRANHVENLVVRDSLLKNCFNVFVGSENTGLSATVATYAGMLSRRHNALVVDLTGHAHYDRYGYETTSLEDFMVERVQNPLTLVVGDAPEDPEQVFRIMEELKARLTYYHHLIVVLDASQHDILDQVGREALTISYLTNCTSESMAAITSAYEVGHTLPNVGHKLVCIDCPVDMGMLVTTLKMDISMTQLIPLPYLREIRQAAIVRQQPHTYNDVLRVFEEAFRV